MREELAQPPAEDEVMEALGKLKGNKAGGKNWHTAGDAKVL